MHSSETGLVLSPGAGFFLSCFLLSGMMPNRSPLKVNPRRTSADQSGRVEEKFIYSHVDSM